MNSSFTILITQTIYIVLGTLYNNHELKIFIIIRYNGDNKNRFNFFAQNGYNIIS